MPCDVGAIDGHVTDLTGNPIERALVIAIQKPVKAPPVFTDKEGNYKIEDLPPGA